MPRTNDTPRGRKHLIILLIALTLALAFLLVRAERASAFHDIGDNPTVQAETVAQITGEDYQSAVNLERLMILGMLGLVVLTWFYLKWRPPPDQGDERQTEPDRE